MTRPSGIKIRLTTSDKIIEVAGWVGLLALWFLTLTNYPELPENIPVHYNGAGEADRFGHRSNFFLLPIIGTVLFIALTILNKFPHLFNYPGTITESNAQHQYTIATRMIRSLKFVIVLVCGLIILGTTEYSEGSGDGLGSWFIPLISALFILPVIYYLIKSGQIEKEKINSENK